MIQYTCNGLIEVTSDHRPPPTVISGQKRVRDVVRVGLMDRGNRVSVGAAK